MKKRNPYPLIRLLLPLVSGILCALYTGAKNHLPFWTLALATALVAVYVFWLAQRITYRTRWIFGAWVFILIFALGYELTVLKTASNEPTHFMNSPGGASWQLMRVSDPPRERERSIRVEAEWLASGKPDSLRPCSGRALLYFGKDTLAGKLRYGDVLLVAVTPEPLAPPANPGAFDYRAYLADRGIYHRAWVPQQDWCKLDSGRTNPVFALAYSMRNRMLQVFTAGGLQGKEYAVASALLLGETDKLDADLMEDYSGTGAMHILSVSGLHVGLIFVILNTLLFFLDRWPRGVTVKGILIILMIWMYALITGLSPSVLRAASMFSLVAAGKLISRETDVYNNMAGSAFVLLLIDPYFLCDLGFQLSYLALLGIVALQPGLASFWSPRWWLIRQGWNILTVSVAAQLATFPLCLHVFHQFPNYFLLANYSALPLSTLIMYVGVAVLCTAFWPWISGLLAKVLGWLVLAMNTSVSWIEDLPGSVTEGVYLSTPATLLLYAAILAVVVFVMARRKAFIFAGLFLLLAFTLVVGSERWRQQSQARWVVWSDKGLAAMDFVHGRTRCTVADSAFLCDARRMDRLTGGMADIMGIRRWLVVPDTGQVVMQWLWRHGDVMQFHERRIALVRQRVRCTQQLRVDYAVITGNPRGRLRDLIGPYHTRMIVIDASNSRSKAERWRKEAVSMGIPCWSVPHDGAWVLDL